VYFILDKTVQQAVENEPIFSTNPLGYSSACLKQTQVRVRRIAAGLELPHPIHFNGFCLDGVQ
jgi:hypothetical protein